MYSTTHPDGTVFKYGHMIVEGDRFTYYECLRRKYIDVVVKDLWPSRYYADRNGRADAPRWAELWSTGTDAIERPVAIVLIDSLGMFDGVIPAAA